MMILNTKQKYGSTAIPVALQFLYYILMTKSRLQRKDLVLFSVIFLSRTSSIKGSYRVNAIRSDYMECHAHRCQSKKVYCSNSPEELCKNNCRCISSFNLHLTASDFRRSTPGCHVLTTTSRWQQPKASTLRRFPNAVQTKQQPLPITV